MTAPARLSPMAGLFNALLRLYIRRARPVITAQQQAVDEARNLNHRLVTAASFRATEAAGYVDRTGLEKTVTAYDALRTAQALAEHGLLDSDAVTRADIDAAADLAGAARPADSHDRHTIRAALDALGETR